MLVTGKDSSAGTVSIADCLQGEETDLTDLSQSFPMKDHMEMKFQTEIAWYTFQKLETDSVVWQMAPGGGVSSKLCSDCKLLSWTGDILFINFIFSTLFLCVVVWMRMAPGSMNWAAVECLAGNGPFLTTMNPHKYLWGFTGVSTSTLITVGIQFRFPNKAGA